MGKNYELMELLGKGGQGEIWKARIKDTGQIVALKIVYVKNKLKIESVINEIKSLEKISKPCHPFLACYYDHIYDEPNERVLIEMEYIKGKELGDWVKEFRRVRNTQALHHNLVLLGLDISRALTYIHSKGIIHRDIKPSNILITNSGIPKLVDFGISCESTLCDVNKVREIVSCCITDDIKGTPYYMSPETISEGVSYPNSDIWSLGVTLFHSATDKFPYDFREASDIRGVFLKIINDTPSFLNTNNLTLNDIVNSSIIKDPFTRISAKQMTDMIIGNP